jgi:prepilin-type processing-associated H-X9-DG protein
MPGRKSPLETRLWEETPNPLTKAVETERPQEDAFSAVRCAPASERSEIMSCAWRIGTVPHKPSEFPINFPPSPKQPRSKGAPDLLRVQHEAARPRLHAVRSGQRRDISLRCPFVQRRPFRTDQSEGITLSTPPSTFSAAGTGLDPFDTNAGGGVAGTGSFALYATGVCNAANADLAQFASKTGRHTDLANYLLADGHVKTLRSTSVAAGNTPSASTKNENQDGGWLAAGTDGYFQNGATKPAATFSTL